MRFNNNNSGLGRLASFVAVALTLALPAHAQVLPGAVQPGRDRQGPVAPPPPDFDFSIVTPHRSAVPRAVDEVHFKLTDIKIVGAVTIPASQFHSFYAGLLGKDVTLGDILDVADKIEAVYRARGYLLVRAYVPPQRVSDGVFTINVVEGYLGGVTVQGGDRSTQRDIRAYLKSATATRPPTLDMLERGLLLTNDIPGVEASGILRPSPDKPGASDLVVDIVQTPITGGIAVDDRGSRFSGIWTVQGDVEFNSLFGADQLAATVTSSPDSLEQIAGTLRYRRAIGNDGLVGTLVGTYTHGEPGSTLSAFHVLTDSWAVGARLTYPLIRSRAETLILDGGFTAQDARVDVAGPVSHDQWRVLDLGGSYQRAGILGGGVWTSTFDVAQGLPILGATPDGAPTLSRLGGHTDFTKLTGTTRLIEPLGGDFSTALNLQGQFAFDRLITGEQVAFGGTQIGRGYDPGAITGDHGLGGSAELRYDFRFADSWLKALQPYVYADAAETWYIHHTLSLPDQNIVSVGGGVRFWLPYDITGALEGARTLHVVPGSDGGKEATKILLDLAVRF
ncbi:MAG TPA: ShlB/FhaC/HecB family hemolysin secretion/activation protein [Rhizomicrobium sp.]|nr:ShlB/FhaC/HecB family hemolysin secretion/activation protein [Rhizomicrobium sp.]